MTTPWHTERHGYDPTSKAGAVDEEITLVTPAKDGVAFFKVKKQ